LVFDLLIRISYGVVESIPSASERCRGAKEQGAKEQGAKEQGAKEQGAREKIRITQRREAIPLSHWRRDISEGGNSLLVELVLSSGDCSDASRALQFGDNNSGALKLPGVYAPASCPR